MKPTVSAKEMLNPMYTDDFSSVKIAVVLDQRKHAKELHDFRELWNDDDRDVLKKRLKPMPVVVRVMYNRTIHYYRTGKAVNPVRFYDMRTAKGNSGDAKLKKDIKIIFDKVVKCAKELIEKDKFNFDRLKEAVTGRTNRTFLSMWMELIIKKKPKTAEAYKNAYNSFVRSAGANIPFERITTSLIDDWVGQMKDKGTSSATIGMYLRAIRIPIRKCISEGLIKQVEFPFGREDDSKVRIPRGKKRTYNFIDIETINTLRSFSCPDKWKAGYAADIYRSIDMWVFSYLSGGINMADIIDLRYNEYYLNSGGNEFQFIRKKTSDSADEVLEVLIPISDDIRSIINKYGAEPAFGERVFPFLLGEDIDVTETSKLRKIEQANQNIRKHLYKVCEQLGLSQRISPTWARHSFKTNATHAGIPHKYVEMAMGHAIGGVEGNYMGVYPFDKRLEYTMALLVPERSTLLSQLKGLSSEELKSLLSQL